jgi:hypothetical protein
MGLNFGFDLLNLFEKQYQSEFIQTEMISKATEEFLPA